MGADQCDQVGLLLKVLDNKLSYKSISQLFGDVVAILKSINFDVKTAFATFWETFGLLFILSSGHTGRQTPRAPKARHIRTNVPEVNIY